MLAARERGGLHAEPMCFQLSREGIEWPAATGRACDAIIGARVSAAPRSATWLPSSSPRSTAVLGPTEPRSVDEPRLHLLGYGDWTGTASATIIGAARTSRSCVAEVVRQPQVG